MLCTLNEKCTWGLKYFTWSIIIMFVLYFFTAVVWSFYFTSLDNSEFEFFELTMREITSVSKSFYQEGKTLLCPCPSEWYCLSWWSSLVKKNDQTKFWIHWWVRWTVNLISCFQLKEEKNICLLVYRARNRPQQKEFNFFMDEKKFNLREDRHLLLSPKSSNAERKNSEISCVAINSSRNWYVQRCIPTIPMIYVL